MHHFNIKTSKIFLGRGHDRPHPIGEGDTPSPDPTPLGKGDTPSPDPTPSAPSAPRFHASGVSAPPPLNFSSNDAPGRNRTYKKIISRYKIGERYAEIPITACTNA